MLQVAVSGFIAIAAIVAAYSGYDMYAARMAQPVSVEAAKSEEPAKTDYITIEIFNGGVVAGYLSFRAVLTLRDPAAIGMVVYHISDVAHRDLAKLTQLVPLPLTNEAATQLRSFLFPALQKRMGPANIRALEVVDVAFDRRIQTDGEQK